MMGAAAAIHLAPGSAPGRLIAGDRLLAEPTARRLAGADGPGRGRGLRLPGVVAAQMSTATDWRIWALRGGRI
jgi:hypothetical protein